MRHCLGHARKQAEHGQLLVFRLLCIDVFATVCSLVCMLCQSHVASDCVMRLCEPLWVIVRTSVSVTHAHVAETWFVIWLYRSFIICSWCDARLLLTTFGVYSIVYFMYHSVPHVYLNAVISLWSFRLGKCDQSFHWLQTCGRDCLFYFSFVNWFFVLFETILLQGRRWPWMGLSTSALLNILLLHKWLCNHKVKVDWVWVINWTTHWPSVSTYR